MYVIGTAGHVDHGKSTLVQALTGINPDRLVEEQRREMTIDLGFAHLALPSGKLVGIVDVPGHERFIKNMLAGVGGIDAALLIVAADEGIMPQTVEHLHILDLLHVKHGVVVLTKRDLVDDEWLELVQEDVVSRLADTPFANAPMIAVSARTGVGLDQLRQTLDQILDRTPSRTAARGVPRLPIDRVFTVGGFGTVVTGTLADGPLAVGQEIAIQPRGLRGRIRGLQTHGTKQDTALPGTRVAANIAGLAVDAVARGEVVTLPGHLTPTPLVDLKLRVVADAPQPIEQNDLLDLFVGAAETPCRVTLLDAEHLLPGAEGWVQLRLQHPVAVRRGDRCIVRIPSPSITVGGGPIIDAHPARHRRFRADVIQSLETKSRGAPDDLLLQALGATPVEWNSAVRESGLDRATAEAAWQELFQADRVLNLAGGDLPASADWVVSAETWQSLVRTISTLLRAYHQRWPLRSGMAREELKSKLSIGSPRLFELVLKRMHAEGLVALTETTVRLPDWLPRLSPKEERQAQALLEQFHAAPFTPPGRTEWELLGAELINYLIENGQIVRVSADVLFAADAYRKLVEWTMHTLETSGEISVAGLRDHFGASRKYALAFLEHLDERRLTRRQGDVRVKY